MNLNKRLKWYRNTILSFITFLFFAFLPVEAYSNNIIGADKGAIIYFDQSKSMSGYFKAKKARTSTLLEIFLQGSLLLTLGENNISPLCIAPFGFTVSQPHEVISPPSCWHHIYGTKKKLETCFPESHTRLDAVFSDANLHKFKIALIITDGIQSIEKLKKSERKKVDKESSLKYIEGSDLGCVKRSIKPLLKEGFGIWLVGILNQFKGYIKSEKPNLQGLRSRFKYNGLRPVFIFVLSKDVKLGRHIALILKKTIEKIRSKFQTEGLKVEIIELSPLIRTEFIPNLLTELPGDTKNTILLDSPKEDKIKKTFTQYGKCRGNKVVEYPLSISALPPPFPSVPQDISWVPRLEMDEWQRGWVSISEGKRNPKKNLWQWSVKIHCGKMPSHIRDSKVCLSIYSEALHVRNVNCAKEWWYEWSTEDDSTEDNASKALNLHKLVSFITTESSAKPKKDSTIIFHFFR